MSEKKVTLVAREIFGLYGYNINYCNVIFLSDNELLEINKSFLGHDYFTDIITFNYGERKDIEAELYISLERVMENAENLHVKLEDELYRVIIHGMLHLCGFKDDTNELKNEMRKIEDKFLELVSRETI